jgi:homoserine kinase
MGGISDIMNWEQCKMSDEVKVMAPASTSNLGPGFDTLGLALGWRLRARGTRAGRGIEIGVEHAGPAEWEGSLADFILEAVRAWEAMSGQRAGGVRLEFKGEIPIARGLGSSASYRTAAAMAVNALARRPLGPEAILELVCRLEKHTDNAVPCMVGGFTASGMDGERVRYARYRVPGTMRFVALIPEFELETKKSRGLLPARVSRESAVFNLQHAMWLVSAIAQNRVDDLRGACADRLHQPFRQKLVPFLSDAIAAAESAGAYAAFLSGSGSTILAIASASAAPSVTLAMNDVLASRGLNGYTRILCADNRGVKITQE